MLASSLVAVLVLLAFISTGLPARERLATLAVILVACLLGVFSRHVIVLAIVLLLPCSAAAGSFLESLAVQAAPQAADVFTTLRARQKVAAYTAIYGPPVTDYEALFAPKDAALFIGSKVVITGGLAWGDHKIGKKSKTVQWIVRGGMFLGYAWVCKRNESQRLVVQ